MEFELRRRALHRAFYIAGNAEALAARLRVPASSLMRWLAGRGLIPYSVFLGAVTLILERPHGEAVHLADAAKAVPVEKAA
ncbi:MAG: hypothetical protein ACM30H_12755 [Clostridia bacterium]